MPYDQIFNIGCIGLGFIIAFSAGISTSWSP